MGRRKMGRRMKYKDEKCIRYMGRVGKMTNKQGVINRMGMNERGNRGRVGKNKKGGRGGEEEGGRKYEDGSYQRLGKGAKA